MEKAAEIREEGALDYRQYRWVGAVLCRGVRRLQRPVVWSTYVQVEGGSRRVISSEYGKARRTRSTPSNEMNLTLRQTLNRLAVISKPCATLHFSAVGTVLHTVSAVPHERFASRLARSTSQRRHLV